MSSFLNDLKRMRIKMKDLKSDCIGIKYCVMRKLEFYSLCYIFCCLYNVNPVI